MKTLVKNIGTGKTIAKDCEGRSIKLGSIVYQHGPKGKAVGKVIGKTIKNIKVNFIGWDGDFIADVLGKPMGENIPANKLTCPELISREETKFETQKATFTLKEFNEITGRK